jgi:hypothetical protein
MVSSKMDILQDSCNHRMRQIHHMLRESVLRIRKMYQWPSPRDDIDDRDTYIWRSCDSCVVNSPAYRGKLRHKRHSTK